MKTIIGHEKIWNFLSQSAARERLAHAYIFVGAPDLGKKKLALEFVKNLQCLDQRRLEPCGKCPQCSQVEKNIHPDVMSAGLCQEESGKEKRAQEIKIEEARRIRQHLALSSFSGKIKAVIIDSAESLNMEAANCLLKTIEEPSRNSLLILIVSELERIPATVLSRCQIIRFYPVRKEIIEAGLAGFPGAGIREIKKAAAYCCGRPALAIRMLRGEARDSQEKAMVELEKVLKSGLTDRFSYAGKLSQNPVLARETMENWLVFCRDKLLKALGLDSLSIFEEKETGHLLPKNLAFSIRRIKKAQDLLKESGFNAKLILENLMLELP